MENKPQYYPKELSWLAFNERVLQEAADTNNPIIERLRFLGIYSNNLDEFFRVRVAEIQRTISVAKNMMTKPNYKKTRPYSLSSKNALTI